MAISAKLVKELRERTGAGMMDCKKALVETDGDIEQAEEHLQKKGLSKAAKKADRVAAEGVVEALANDDHTEAVLVEVNSETDFVARNEDFKKFTALVVEHALNEGIDSADALLDSEIDGKSVEDRRKALIATIGENITVRRVVRAAVEGNGVIGDYVHNGNIGVLVTLEASDDVSGNDDAYELARDIAMHTAAMNPDYARQEDIDEEALKAQESAEVEKAMESGKPEEIAKKMVQGRMRKWKEQICLVDQPFVKNSDLTVGEEIERVADEIGTDLKLLGFERLVRGEGIEKDEANLADEVASALK
jgi:elongation factor Ts